jgi:hypothetical protein
MEQVSYKVARLRRTLLIIILATIPCYLLGIFVLWVADQSKKADTPTPTVNAIFITAPPPPTETSLPPTKYPTRTATVTPTITLTPTETLPPTIAPTEIPTDIPTDIPTIPTVETVPATEPPAP